MKKPKLKLVVLALGLGVFSQMATAAITSDKAIVKNDGSERVTAKVSFPTPVSGDLYVATQVGGQFLFLTNGGSEFTTDVVPLESNSEYVGERDLFDFSGAGIAPGEYPLYQVVTQSGTSPLDFTNWVGGLSGLHAFNFSIGLGPELTKDFNGDGFADDDKNHDGFHDQPRNDQSGNEQSGNEQSGNDQSGNDQSGNEQSGNDQLGNDQSGNEQSGNDQSENDSEDNNQPTPTPSAAKGKSLYSVNCSDCHGATPRYNKISRAVNPSRTRSAIKGNKGGMGYLKFLSDTELQLIANYVKKP
ncbi:c-type cytochrome [methanotrophic endosymbiont of Bathymodiolus puteoserpentis (Logatchev)]|uniref:c-type cytochrome n=1 Tax=methanotrophic endosymbiont of Bathymodiolus puteoserpentis (Logatchev) TaxID=343235 RepID=UPI0013C6EF49|nr:cytochrome c [methanotrophic endosymbiont of Bathymodiolus puteoserpentis (Logatchev)]SHE23154.1 Enoyl-CoA hydratase [methanotrophic endosymbiont of Bathymodiolus puteoserpentis (Logatchev)]